MTSLNGLGRADWLRCGVGLYLGLVWLALPTKTYAICGLDAAVFEQIRNVQDLDAARAWSRQILQHRGMSCVVCHVAGYGPRNQYGSAINVLLTGNDREDPARKREAGRRVNDIPADPALPDSPTFGDLIQQGLLPASYLTPDLLAFRHLSAKPSEEIHSRLEEMERAALRARSLTQQLITFAQGGVPVRLPGTLPDLIRDASAFVLRGSNVRCNFRFPRDLWWAEFDQGQIIQVILGIGIFRYIIQDIF